MSLYYKTHSHQMTHLGEMGDRDDWIREIAELPFHGVVWLFLFLSCIKFNAYENRRFFKWMN